jgi:hypothetical protein
MASASLIFDEATPPDVAVSPSALLQREEKVHDLRAGSEIEIAGRLIGKDELRVRRKGARNRHPLLLAAGELAREMRLAMRQPDLTKRRARLVEGVGLVEEFEGQRHVLERGHGRHEVEGLEHDADIGGTEPSEAILIEGGVVGAGNVDAAAGRSLEACGDHEESRFAGAARADHGDGITHRNFEVDAAQDGHRACARGQRHLDAFEQNRWRLARFDGVIHGRAGRLFCATASLLER